MLSILFALGVGVLLASYFLYGKFIDRQLEIDDKNPTPAHSMRDDVDYCPVSTPILFGHHFSSIAGAGPIVGPILATVYFGWLPAVLWILFGAVLIGGVQDYTSLIASVRHKARSIAEIAKEYVSPLSQKLLLVFIWLALVLVLIAFADITSTTFVGKSADAGDEGVALSSTYYLILALLLGIAVQKFKVKLLWASLIAVPLVFLGIWWGQSLQSQLPIEFSKSTWSYLLFVYCFIASVAPVWLLLQPRDFLSGFLLYACIAAGLCGILFGDYKVDHPSFIAWSHQDVGFLFPALFITVACGACSGFHSIVSSGTTSKQLPKESKARCVGYGGMLVEGGLALIAVACVVVVGPKGGNPVQIFSQGIGQFTAILGISPELGSAFGSLALSTFLLTTLDTCTRLGRYVFCELTKLSSRIGGVFATAITLSIPVWMVGKSIQAGDKVLPLYKVVWPVFGSTNQLLGGFALMVLASWLRSTGRNHWFVSLPACFMFAASATALIQKLMPLIVSSGEIGLVTKTVAYAAGGLLILAAIMLVESIRVFIRPLDPKLEKASMA